MPGIISQTKAVEASTQAISPALYVGAVVPWSIINKKKSIIEKEKKKEMYNSKVVFISIPIVYL
jgi:hypothetical protein